MYNHSCSYVQLTELTLLHDAARQYRCVCVNRAVNHMDTARATENAPPEMMARTKLRRITGAGK